MYQNNVNFCFPLAAVLWCKCHTEHLPGRTRTALPWHAHHNLINQTKVINQAIAYGRLFFLGSRTSSASLLPSGSFSDCWSLQVN